MNTGTLRAAAWRCAVGAERVEVLHGVMPALVPGERATGLVLDDAGFEEVAFLLRSIISLIQGKGFSSFGKRGSRPIWVARRLAM